MEIVYRDNEKWNPPEPNLWIVLTPCYCCWWSRSGLSYRLIAGCGGCEPFVFFVVVFFSQKFFVLICLCAACLFADSLIMFCTYPYYRPLVYVSGNLSGVSIVMSVVWLLAAYWETENVKSSSGVVYSSLVFSSSFALRGFCILIGVTSLLNKCQLDITTRCVCVCVCIHRMWNMYIHLALPDFIFQGYYWRKNPLITAACVCWGRGVFRLLMIFLISAMFVLRADLVKINSLTAFLRRWWVWVRLFTASYTRNFID